MSQPWSPSTTLRPGRPYPLGAHADESGVNFALFSENAERVELCLFEPDGRTEISRLELPEHTDQIWHGYLAGAAPGLHYAYRVHGRSAPEEGHRFDPTRHLCDPYARSWSARPLWSQGHDGPELHAPVCVVTRDPEPARRPASPMFHPAERIIYEAHVKGLTALHPAIPPELRGTYAGLGSQPVIEHLLELGVTTIELMPCQAFVDEAHLVARGLTNYWGYNPLGFFVVEPRYAAGTDPLGELRETIARLHAAGLEVILDVVYNHTAEGDERGPTLAFRGIDNASYYRLEESDPSRHVNVTGCGNTLDLSHPRVLQLVMDSLRWWIEIVGVDGFRFDLATALGREEYGFDPGAGFFDAIRQDPLLGRATLIAEPWDIGADGYRMGGFGPGWAEWNDRFRDTTRAYWRGDGGVLPHLASALLGSADLFEHQGRRPWASINFLTSHDGFTLHDLVAFENKHNWANGENNRDGHGHNLSWNNGIEGPTDEPAIRTARLRDRKNLIATLLLSQGTPMMLMGDELGRTQQGNNNAYCQDNETNWLDWSETDRDFFAFVRKLVRLRKDHPVFRRGCFMHGENGNVRWWHPDGREMEGDDWSGDCLGLVLDGAATAERDDSGELLTDGRFLLLLNAGEAREAVLPEGSWHALLATAEQPPVDAATTCPVPAGSLALLVDRPARE